MDTFAMRHRPQHERGRTNSLGSAKVDCHTCVRLRKRCDRQRPRCGTCINGRRDCGGFAVDLIWKDHVTESRSPTAQRSDSDTNISPGSNSCRRPLRFVQGRPKSKRKPKVRRSEAAAFSIHAATESSVLSDVPRHVSKTYNDGVPPLSPDRHEVIHLVELSTSSSYQLDDTMSDSLWASETIYPTIENNTDPYSCVVFDAFGDNPSVDCSFSESDSELPPKDMIGNHARPPEAELEMSVLQGVSDHLAIPPAVLFLDHTHKMKPVLIMYDREFCILPITMDCDNNPFRVSQERWESSPFLLHAILALSSQHLAKQRNCAILTAETHRHRATAVQLYSQALGHSNPILLLDTLLMLISFEISQSGLNAWGVHLRGALKMLDILSIAEAFRSSSRVRAQIAMLVWWDITVALISRKEPILPAFYLETLIEHDESDDGMFFSLNGCPAELMMAMRRLAQLASIYEKAAGMEWTTFNTQPVDAVVDKAINYKNRADLTLEELGQLEEDPGTRRDRFHCIEAWRHAIILYARRVFGEKQDAYEIRAVGHLARVILDHVRCIPLTAVVQKQVLLPVFLSAAELGDHSSRDFVRQYCTHWCSTARYSQFETALRWLERIWAGRDSTRRGSYWWGCQIKAELGESVVDELLLG